MDLKIFKHAWHTPSVQPILPVTVHWRLFCEYPDYLRVEGFWGVLMFG